MSKRTRKPRKRKRRLASTPDKVYVGLDVHKKTVYAAVHRNGTELKSWAMPAGITVILAALEPWRGPSTRVVYEAGPTGYGLARALKKAGFQVAVVAPGKTPRPANPGNKSDRLDCRRLAEYAAQGSLKPVAIPTKTEEADRQIVRLRQQLATDQRRVKQRIKSFLLYHGIPEPDGLAHWSEAGIAAVRRLKLHPALRLTLDVLVEELVHLSGVLKRVETEIARLAQTARHTHQEKQLRSHPGVGRLTAMSFLSEVYRPERFQSPRQVTAYVGLAPRVRQSGGTRREGPLIKAGRGALRALLVEASWRWIRDDPQARAIYRRLVHNTGSSNKAIVGMARRMAMNLWCMLVREQDYLAAA